MSYSDIIELVKHDGCSKIIYAIKKTPGVVSFQNGEFQYSGAGKNRAFRWFDRWFTRFSIWFFAALLLFSLAVMGFGHGATSVVGFLLLIFSSVMLALQLRQRAYDQMVASLVAPE